MRKPGRLDGSGGERAVAWSLVVVVHVSLLWWLARPIEQDVHPDAGALQIHWIERAAPIARVLRPRASPSPPRRQAARAPPPARSAQLDAALPPGPVSQEVERPQPMSAVFIEQGRRWAEAQAPIGDFSRNPFARREDLVAAVKADRFRMREAITPDRVVRQIAVLFGGPGYTTDPCPRVRGNLANLTTGTDRNLVEEEVRRLRRLCQ